MKEITDKVLESVAVYMDDDLREWTHYHYCGESNEEFVKQYFLRLCYEQGENKADEFESLLWDEFEIDINDYVTFEEKQDAIYMYEETK